MPKVGSRRKKTRTHVQVNLEEQSDVPKSMVIKRTSLSSDLKGLEKGLRDTLYPFTAMKYKESTKIKLKEVLQGAKAFGVQNLFLLSSKDKGDYIKFARAPADQTFTFKIIDYSLSQDLIKSGVSEQVEDVCQMGIPMLLTRGFDQPSKGLDVVLVRQLEEKFIGLFPSVDYFLENKINKLRRIVVIIFDAMEQKVHIRNFKITKNIQAQNSLLLEAIQRKAQLDFSKVHDVSQLLISKEKNTENSQEKIKLEIDLKEIGPRIGLQLLKIQSGVLEGQVQYHRQIQKTDSQIRQTEEKRNQKKKLKEERK